MAATFQTLRNHDVNFGDRTKLRGSERMTLAWINVEESAAYTVYASARLSGPAASVSRTVASVRIEWGHGGACVQADYPIVRRLRVPLAASMIKLEGSLLDVQTGAPAPSDVEAEISAFIACGTDNETIPNARTIVQSGESGVLGEGAQRILAVHGHNGGSVGLWLMLFDAIAVPANGAAPRLAVPAPSALTAPFSLRPASPRDFLLGAVWAASSNALVLQREPNASLHVEAELML